MMNLKCALAFPLVLGVLTAVPASPCDVIVMQSPADLVRQADAIVVVRSLSYATAPSEKYGPNGEPESRVRFQVVEVLKGSGIGNELVLPGFLGAVDDFNDQRPPYTSVRSFGRRANCFADEYRQGGLFLLFLTMTERSGYTARWAPLAPINEQLHAGEDPWLAWVRGQLK